MGRKKQKVRWTSVESEGFFTNENEDVEQSGAKTISSVNGSTIDTSPNNYCHQKRVNKRTNKKPKYLMSQVSQEKNSANLEVEVEKTNRGGCRNTEGKSVTGCGSKDCNSCTCDMYCCCTTHENSAICDDIPKYQNTSKTTKMDQANPESNSAGNSADFNEATVIKDCDTNSEHSSMMNESVHSSCNNSNRSMQRMESFSSSGTGSRDYDRPSNHGERRFDRKYHYNRDGSRRGYGGGDRGGGGSWINAPLAPRFERKAAIHAANAAANGNSYNSHHFPDQNASNSGMCYDDNNYNMTMDMEDLPNGFTKIRSKNLDVLFKKDYYAHRVHLNSGSSGTGTAGANNSCSVSPNPQVVSTSQPAVASDATQPEVEAADVSVSDRKEDINSDSFNQTNEELTGNANVCSVECNIVTNHNSDSVNTDPGSEDSRDVKESNTPDISSNQTAENEDIQIKADAVQQSCNSTNTCSIVAQELKIKNETSLTQSETLNCVTRIPGNAQADCNIDEANVSNVRKAEGANMNDQNLSPTEYPNQVQDGPSQNNSNINTNATPFYPRGQISPSTCQLQSVNDETSLIVTSTENPAVESHSLSNRTSPKPSPQDNSATVSPNLAGSANNNRPNLFLYSPCSNTIIPCEEIIIPNHPNVMQLPVNPNQKDKSCSPQRNIENGSVNTMSSETSVATNSPNTSTTNTEGSKKEHEQCNPTPQNILTHPIFKVENTISRESLTASTNSVSTGSKVSGFTSPTTPGMNGNAPAFIPRQQQHYFPASLNMQHVPQQPHTMIHYDQFGAPYTSYHPTTATLPPQTSLTPAPTTPSAHGMSSIQHPVISRDYMPANIPYHQQSSVLSTVTSGSPVDMVQGVSPTTSNGPINSSSETSSAESTAPIHSPADLSVYSPANWVQSHGQATQGASPADQSRNANIQLHQQMAFHRVDGSELTPGGPRPLPMQQTEFHRSMSSPASYGNPAAHVPNVPGSVPYGQEAPLSYQQRSQYPPHYNSHVYYQPSAPSAHYINSQGGSNVWYNLHQQQYYSMNGTQAFVGPQYQGYVNGYTSNSGGTNLQFMCESSTMPSSAGDSMAEDDPRDRSEEEIDANNQSRTHVQAHQRSQAPLTSNNNIKQNLSSITDQERLNSQKQQNHHRHPISNTVTVMVSNHPGSGNFSSKKDRETREGSNGMEGGSRPFIPGLPADRVPNKRVHKKRRKRKNIYNDGQVGEQASCPTQSSISSPDLHSGMSSLITAQQLQKGKCITNIHRGSSSSEDLFAEENIIRSDTSLIKLSATNSNTIEIEGELEADIGQVNKFSNNNDPQGSEIKGCDEGNQIDASSNKTFLNERKLNPVCSDSTTSKSSGCDNIKAAYQVCESLAEGTVEGAMPSLPTTSPSSPLQSMNPSSSSIVVSSSCLSSQEEDENEKGTGQDKEASGLRNEIRRNGGYDACLPKGNHNRDRSSSLSSNEEMNNSCKDKKFNKASTLSESERIDLFTNTPNINHDKHGAEYTSKNKPNVDCKGDNNESIQATDVNKHAKDSDIMPPHKTNYADTLKKKDTAVVETVPFKADSTSRYTSNHKERNQPADNETPCAQAVTAQGKSRINQQGTQPRHRNKRINNTLRSTTLNENNQKNSNMRGSQTPLVNKLQRSFSSPQNSQYKDSNEDMTGGGKKLYSTVACKATVSNINKQAATPHSFKSHGSSQRGNANTKPDSSPCKKYPQEKFKLDKQSPDNSHEEETRSPNIIGGEILRRNSADDAGWEVAKTHGGSKTKRNRKGNRGTSSSNTDQPLPLPNDSSSNNKNSTGQHPCSKQSPADSPSEGIDELSEFNELENDSTTIKDNHKERGESISADEENSVKEVEAFITTVVPAENDEKTTIQTPINSTDEKTSPSTPPSKSSTLRRQRKKRSTQDPGNPGTAPVTNITTTSTIRPVLIQDGAIDIFGKGTRNSVGTGINGSTLNSSKQNTLAAEILDEAQIDEAVQKGHIDTLFISEIGYGMVGGPISMGRFGTSKYTPPDRSEEILPMQKLLQEKQKAEEEAEAVSKSMVIKVLMGEVQVSTASALAGTTLTSVQTDTKSEGRFQDVTDNINESGEVEQKLNATKSRLTITSKPADLDLD